MNVLINLTEISDGDYVEEKTEQTARLLGEVRQVADRVVDEVMATLGEG